MKKKLITILIFIVLGTILSLFIYNSATFTKKTLEKNYAQWDLLRYQNTIDSGEYLGFLYEQNYDINSLPKNYVLYLLTNYYISYDSDFFTDTNQIEDSLYQKEVSSESLNQTLSEMFGPNYPPIEIDNTTFSCGRSITKINNDSYTIKAKHPEVCGAFDDTKDQYISHIASYSKKDNQIIIDIKVAYMSPSTDGRIVLYNNKNKLQALDYNYSYSCLGSTDENCYNTFSNYQVTLKKATDNEYYFYSITKA